MIELLANNPTAGRWIVGFGFTGASLIFHGVIVYQFFRFKKEHHYDGVTTGVVTGTGMDGTRLSGDANTIYIPRVEYEYEVAGKKYTSDIVGVMGAMVAKPIARLLLRKYHVGKQVTVYYKSEDPETAALWPTSWKIFLIFFFLFISMFTTLGICALTGAITIN